jgi:olefin beta-lactone synthetase
MILSLTSRLQENASRFPDKPVFIYQDRRGSWQTVTYRQLNERSRLMARGIAALGIQPGMRAVLMTPPSIDFFALALALLGAGVVSVMIDPGIGLRSVTTCLAAAQPEVYFGSALTHMIRRLFGWGQQSLRLNLSTADVARAGSYASTAAFAADPVLPVLVPESEAAIVYTSGSTGLPKGAVFSHANFAAQMDMLVQGLDLQGDEIDLPAFPLFALIDCLLGVTAIIPDMRFPRPAQVDPALLITAIQTQHVDTMFASPAALDRLARYAIKHQITLPGLKRVITAGAPAPTAVQEMFHRLLVPEAKLVGVYGSTETLPVTLIDSREVLNETRYLSDQGAGVCIGRPANGAQVRVITISDEVIPQWRESLQLPVGEVGEITVKGGAVTESYVGQEQATVLAKIRDTDGKIIHRMGDLGYFDAQGRLWYCGRKSHRVVTAGGTLFTEKLEGIFNAHPRVYRSALVGVQRAGFSEPVLWVELNSTSHRADPNQVSTELLELAKGHAAAQHIKTFLFHRHFPTDIRHNSKIIREKLAELARKRR